MIRKIIIAISLVISLFPVLNAQNLTLNYTNPTGSDALVICDSAAFQISLANNSNSTASNVLLTFQFPSGIAYCIGSNTNFVEFDLSNLNAPVFSLSEILPNQNQSITIWAKADCSLISAINNMDLFSNNMLATYTDGSENVVTTPYNIETPLLVLTNNGGLIQSGSQGDILFRTFTITNTRLGALRSFIFRDSHEGGIEITTNLGTDISTLPNSIEVVLDGDDFMTIGDGDAMLELNESITIVEEILITSCGTPLSSTLSNISVTWGCNNAICQSTPTLEAYIDIETVILEPMLSFTPIADTVPLCYCTGEPVQHGLIITNNSNTPATSIKIEVEESNSFAGIDPVSFLILSNNISTPLPEASTEQLQLFSPGCNVPFTVFRDATLTLPITLEPGESITLFWNVYLCALDCSPHHSKPWKYTYGYYSICPPVPFITGENIVPHVGPTINSGLQSTSSDPIPDGGTIHLEYYLTSSELLNSGENLSLVFEIPCGLSMGPGNELLFDGQSPNSYTVNATDTISYITVTYSPPFFSDSIFMTFDLELDCANICEELLCKDTVITSCMEQCGTEVPQGLAISVNSFLQVVENCPANCNLNSCATEIITPGCPIPLCEEYVPGYADFTYTASRVNFGLPDNNDDRLSDAGGSIDFDLVRRDRIIAGDTVQIDINSVVVIDEEGYSFPAGQILIYLAGGVAFQAINNPLFETGGFLPVSQRLVIYDHSSGNYYTCNNVPITINTLDNTSIDGGFSFQFDISPNVISGGTCNLPSDFEYAEGDSILFSQQFKINYNIIPGSGSSTPPIVNIRIAPEVFLLSDNNTPTEDWFSCNCSSAIMQLSGYRYNVLSGIHPIPDCEGSIYVGGTFFSFLLGMGNFFPYEHRSLGQLTDWQVELPAGFSIIESKLTSMNLQENILLFNEVPLNPLSNNTLYQYNLLPFQTPHLDEGFSILIQNRFEADCGLTDSHPLTVHAEITPAPNLLFTGTIDTTVVRQAALRMLVPDLELDATFFNYVSYNDIAQWDFSLTNNAIAVASFISGAADNVWVRPYSANGLVSSFVLSDANTGTLFPQTNGIFQLGSLDSLSTIHLHLEATNSSCAEESIILHYGWNCTPYNNVITTPCFKSFSLFTVLSPPASLEQTVESPIGSHFLCDTIDFHSITVSNANLGTAYNIAVSIQLPTGVYILPGSCEIAYPLNNAFTPIPNPINTGTGTLQWDVAALQDSIGQNGLPGFIFNPNHSFQIRFKLFTDCDFIAGSYPIFFVGAEQVCGLPTNTLAEAGAPIILDGLPPPYHSSISVNSPTPVISCQDSVLFNINISADASTLTGDSLYITLPSGISYVPNSISGNANASVTEPVVDINNNLHILKWPLLGGVIAGEAISFEIMLQGFSDLECGSSLILLQTVGPISAPCVSDNSVCDIQIESGSNIVQLDIDRPSFDLNNFTINVTPGANNTDVLTYSILLNNNGFTATPPITLDFYLDTDNTGDWTATDVFITSSLFNNTITSGGSINLTGNFSIANGQACAVIAVIDPEKHCSCMVDEQNINTTINYLVPDAVILCSGANQSIGISQQPGAIYQWSPANGLDCATCATTAITLSNNSNNTNTIIYTLQEDNGNGCITAYQFTFEVQPEPDIDNSSENICPGDSVLLEATAASSYFWSGPEITNPGLPTQLVSPAANAVYTVLLTNAFGCSGMDSILIIVAEAPFAFAGNDTLFCENGVAQLQAFSAPDYSYLWSPANLLVNPNSANPIITNPVPTTFSLVVTNGEGCENTDQIVVDFGATPTLLGETEAGLCSGDSVLLSFSGALNYFWSPATGLSCATCPITFASPEVSTIYTLTGSDANGCSESILVSVNLFGIISLESSELLCEGDSLFLFGQFITSPGIYCDTIVSQLMGCDTVHCFTVAFQTEINTEEEHLICEGESIVIAGTSYETAGVYCSVFQTFAGCDSTHCLRIEVAQKPVIELIAEHNITLGDTVALGPLPGGYSYSWSPSEGLSCTDCPNPLASPTVDMVYQVIVVGDLGCQNDYEVSIRTVTPICEPPYIFIPNAFTPNGDAENDVLRVYGNGITRLHLVIFNRWGEKVFETFEVDGYWDGTYNGKALGSDVFGYYLDLDCIGGGSFSKKGNVTILK
jgi:gliding motility-associated-like protein